MSDDGLYLAGQWVAEVAVALTLQGNDLRQPDTLQASRTNAFTLPDTLLLRSILKGAEQIDSYGPNPYAPIPAELVTDGEVVFTGNAKLMSFSGGWKVTLFGPLKGLFEQMANTKLRDLNLSAYDHPWTDESITNLAGKSSGVTYPCIDYGNYEAGVFGMDSLFPALHLHTLVGELLRSVNYRAVGSWVADLLYKRIAVPFTEDAPTNKDADFVRDRTARVTVAVTYPLINKVNQIIPFTVDNIESQAFTDGKADNFKPSLNAYVCDAPMRLRVQWAQRFSAQVDFGAMEVKLIIERNGVNVGQGYFTASGPFNLTGTATQMVEVDELIECKKGDQIRLRLVVQKRTTIAQWIFSTTISPTETIASFTPDSSVRPGDTWPVARNLPDLTGADILKTVALLMGGTYRVDDTLKTVELITLDSVKASTAIQDLSNCVEESVEPEHVPTIEGYGKVNKLQWKNQELITPYGDGQIESPVLTSPAEAPLFELVFGAVTDSPRELSGYGKPLLIQTRTFSGTGSNRTISVAATTPRLILVEPTKTIVTTAKYVNTDGSTRTAPVTLTGCWFAIRPSGVKASTNNFSLCFDRPSELQGEQALINRYFLSLKGVLQRPRTLTPSMTLRPDQIATLDLSKPVWLARVRAGSLYLSGNLYYLNTVSNYRSGPPCPVTLIPFD